MLLPRPACNDTAVLITRGQQGKCGVHLFGIPGFRRHSARQPYPGCVEVLSAGELNPDVRAGSCSAQQRNGLLRLQRVRADEPAETHGQTGRQAERQTGVRGGGDSLFRLSRPFADRAEPPPVSTQNPHPLVSRFGWGESRARRGGPGVLFPVSLRMTARFHPRPTSATTGRAAPWVCGAAR